ncbi:cylI protein, partial [Streptococcus agalactiae]|nr:cylI protein [Streptococcus agalactiae]
QLKYSHKTFTDVMTIFDAALQNLLSDLGLTIKDIKGFVWNERKKAVSSDYDFLANLSEYYNMPNLAFGQFGFSSNGAGEELDYTVNESIEKGYYLVLSYSIFGGISFAIIEKR